MEDITQELGSLYFPKSALVFYQSENKNEEGYVEHFDMDEHGHPINAHPLTEREAQALTKSLLVSEKTNHEFLNSKGVLPSNILQINFGENGSVVWFTKAKKRKLFFAESLEIPNGYAEIPAMLWYADKKNLKVFALKSDRRPTENTPIFHAPYFNIYENGSVCMGTVNVEIKKSACIEEFTKNWEDYFFNSYFSHLMNGHNPTKGNCLQLWKDLVDSKKPFPKEVLIKTDKTIKNLVK